MEGREMSYNVASDGRAAWKKGPKEEGCMQISGKFLEPFSQSVLSSTYRALLTPLG